MEKSPSVFIKIIFFMKCKFFQDLLKIIADFIGNFLRFFQFLFFQSIFIEFTLHEIEKKGEVLKRIYRNKIDSEKKKLSIESIYLVIF